MFKQSQMIMKESYGKSFNFEYLSGLLIVNKVKAIRHEENEKYTCDQHTCINVSTKHC